MKKILSVPEKHRKEVCIKTLKMNDVFANIMGGPTKEESRQFLRSIGYTEREIRKLEEA